MTLVFDIIEPQELVGFVRNLPFSDFVLEQYLPNELLDDVEYRFTKSNLLDQDVAYYRGWDTEAPIGNRQGLSRVMGEIPPLSKKIRLGEEQRLRMRAMESGDMAPIIRQIFDDAANMTRAVQARLEMARGRALYDGKFVASENGFIQTVDYGIPGDHRVSPTTVWSTVASATPVLDLRTWIQKYTDDNGFPPALLLTSTAVVTNLLRNAEIRALAQTLGGVPNLVTVQTLRQVFEAFGFPPIVVNDEKVMVNGSSTRTIPANLVVFLPPAGAGLGRTFYGITAEALELQSAGQIVSTQAAGVVAVVEKTFDPVSTWTKAAAVAMPVIANPQQLMVATVQ